LLLARPIAALADWPVTPVNPKLDESSLYGAKAAKARILSHQIEGIAFILA